MRVLRVLMWKYMKAKIRRPFFTIWELLSGISVFVLLLLVKQALMADSRMINLYPGNQETYFLASIIFYPFNKLSESLMQSICAVPGVSNKEDHFEISCAGVDNENEVMGLINKYKNHSVIAPTVAVIEFHNLNGTKYPEKLEYDFKFNEPNTEQFSKLEDLYRIYQKDPVLPKNLTFFADLQWKIDKAFLQQTTGHEINHLVQFHDITEHVSPEMRVIHSFLIFCTIFTPLPYFLYTSSRLVLEKRSGLRELVNLVGVSRFTLRLAHFLEMSVFATVYALIVTVLLKVSHSPVLGKSNFFLLLVFFWLHFVTINSLTFVSSTLSQNYQHSDTATLLLYLFTFIMNSLWYHQITTSTVGLAIIYCILPHAPVFAFWDEVTTLEDMDEGLTFSTLWKITSTHTTCQPVGMIWLYCVIHLTLIMLLAGYLDMVRPGRYGIAAKWNYLFKKKFWSIKKKRGVNFHMTAEKKKGLQALKDDRYFEKPQRRTKIAVKIAHVTKVFRNFREPEVKALDNLCLDIYKGEITVLLGPNGAGKTTLMSVITGMYDTTEGTIYVNGLDNSARLEDVRRDIAYCPQRDMTFDYLTVREHLLFFQQLRGQKSGEKEFIESVMKRLKLTDVRNLYSSQLSSGMKRCLQVACVLVGDSDVLVLDEPTSGMDAQMRHHLWDILLTLRKEKTIVMTTRMMQEADALGDRIAILNHGKIKCHGSPNFLKNAIGADFKLCIRFDHHKDLSEISKIVEDKLKTVEVSPKATDVSVIEHRLSVILPSAMRENFPKVFDVLEANRKELGISAMDVGISMEQVFLRFIDDTDEDLEQSFRDIQQLILEKRLEGWRLARQQLKLLTLRVFTFVWRNKYQFIILQIIIPFLAMIVVTLASNTSRGYGKVYDSYTEIHKPATIVLDPATFRRKSANLEPLLRRYPNVNFVTSHNLDSDMKLLSRQFGLENNPQPIFGFKIGPNKTDIYYKTDTFSLSQAMNVFSNLYMSLNTPTRTRNEINMMYSPLYSSVDIKEPKNLYLCGVWSIWIIFLSIVTVAPLLLLCIDEYHKGVRFRHILAGCSPTVIWLSKLIAHMSIYTATVPTMIIFVASLIDTDSTFSRPGFLAAVFVLMMLFGPAFFTRWYVFSFIINKHHPVTRIFFLSLCLGGIAPVYATLLSDVAADSVPLATLFIILFATMIAIPEFIVSYGLYKISTSARNNAYCKLNYHLCPDNFPSDRNVERNVCCDSETGEPFNYYKIGYLNYLLLPIQTLFYWMLLMMLQHRTIQTFWEHVVNHFYKAPTKCYKTQRVKREEEYVHFTMEAFRQMTMEERQHDPDVLLAENLHKAHRISCGKAKSSINSVGFSVRRGECLGLIGRNSSGKSDVLEMIAGFTAMTRGETCVNGYFLPADRRKYLRNIAWTMTGGCDEFFSGYKNLKLLASLYGFPELAAERIALYYLHFMGLSRHTHALFSSYSPGCAQRLAVSISLLGKPVVVLLDEPCANVDPFSRPLVTRAVRRLLDGGAACVIAEESMEWRQVDRICSRLAILDRGEIIAIGSVNEIREELASGYTCTFKLKIEVAYATDDINADEIDRTNFKNLIPVESVHNVKLEFMKMFPTSVLVDEHMSMLYFHIRDPQREIPYSEMFSKLEKLKNVYDVIEDYTLSEISVEEVLCRIEQELHGAE